MNRKRPVWEWLLFMTVVVVALYLVGSTYTHQQNLYKEESLRGQLQVLRSAVLLYETVNLVKPQSLNQLVTTTYTTPGDNQAKKYLQVPITLVDNKLVDPFGNPYAFNAGNGWVASSTEGYKYW